MTAAFCAAKFKAFVIAVHWKPRLLADRKGAGAIPKRRSCRISEF